MNTALTAVNVVLMTALIVSVARAAQLHQLARREYYAAMTALNLVHWCHARMREGWHPWDEYPPPGDMLIDVLQPGDMVPKIMRAPQDQVPALAVAWWRPIQPRDTISHIGGIA